MANHEISYTLDVQGISCPVNAVRVKAAVGELKDGELLEVLVDEGEAVLRVARTLKDSGYRIVKVEPREQGLSVIVSKK